MKQHNSMKIYHCFNLIAEVGSPVEAYLILIGLQANFVEDMQTNQELLNFAKSINIDLAPN